ncbi:MAG TPA: thiamine phosphate synthase [Polyangiaceae bacterium]|nr:thiamine phosphate synthase [Polyangiaceae bacterium]
MRTRGLYPIVDVAILRARGLDVVDFAARVLAARPGWVQLRAKTLGARETLELLRALVPLCRAAGALLFANDRPDVAVLAGADGVHVGQSDLSVADVRRFAPALKVGTSTHDERELEAALAERPDYVAFGPVFATSSKANPEPVVGLARLARASEKARAVGIPLVAIGGIDRERAASIAELECIGAVIGALLPLGTELAQTTELALALERALTVSA